MRALLQPRTQSSSSPCRGRVLPALAAGALLAALVAGCKPGRAGGPPPERKVQVVIARAERQPVSENLALIGNVQASEMVQIQAETDGLVSSIHFQEGQRVAQGDLLIQLDDTKLAAQLAQAEANFKLSEANQERNRQLFEERLISREEFDRVSAAFDAQRANLELRRRELRDTRIVAPFAGIVGARQISPGQVISRSTALTWLVDLDEVKVEIPVPERFVGRLREGQEIAVTTAAFPGRAFRGRVYFVAPFVDPDTRTALVKARMPNADHALKPGMFASLELTLTTRENAVVIPEEAVVKLGEDNAATIYAVDGERRAAMRQVTLGVRMPGKVEVTRGLEGGEEIIVEGHQKVAPGTAVTLGGEPAGG